MILQLIFSPCPERQSVSPSSRRGLRRACPRWLPWGVDGLGLCGVFLGGLELDTKKGSGERQRELAALGVTCC